MKNAVIAEIKNKMMPYLNEMQIVQLSEVLNICLQEYFLEADHKEQPDIIQTFLAAKRVEGCSDKTLRYYDSTIRNVLKATGKQVQDISTDDLRIYYSTENGNCQSFTYFSLEKISSTSRNMINYIQKGQSEFLSPLHIAISFSTMYSSRSCALHTSYFI